MKKAAFTPGLTAEAPAMRDILARLVRYHGVSVTETAEALRDASDLLKRLAKVVPTNQRRTR